MWERTTPSEAGQQRGESSAHSWVAQFEASSPLELVSYSKLLSYIPLTLKFSQVQQAEFREEH